MNSVDCFKLDNESVVASAVRSTPGGCAPPKMRCFRPFEPAGVSACVKAAIFICALSVADLAHGDELRCPDSSVVVHSSDSSDAGSACEAAAEASGFLAANGLDTTREIEVHLVSELPKTCLSAFGCYDHPNRRAYMLVYSECLKKKTWCELPVDRALYKSLLTHEIAHAVAAANFSLAKPGMLAHEYLAYITMFATMPPRQRERVLERFPGKGFDSPDQMSETFYLIDPLRFGAEAYRHFLKPGNGKAFLKEVLSGRALNRETRP